jgi:hypothetical protein
MGLREDELGRTTSFFTPVVAKYASKAVTKAVALVRL